MGQGLSPVGVSGWGRARRPHINRPLAAAFLPTGETIVALRPPDTTAVLRAAGRVCEHRRPGGRAWRPASLAGHGVQLRAIPKRSLSFVAWNGKVGEYRRLEPDWMC